MKHALRVIADDLTGACDVAAELLPWPGGVVVCPTLDAAQDDGAAPPDATLVRNTHSRTLPAEQAVSHVRSALAGTGGAWRGIVLKKIDTGLRGALGAELEAAMQALGIEEAFVLPAIPEVGRTTEGGRQLIGGVPVNETAFARDPQNPIRDARVATVIAATTELPTAELPLDCVRGPDGGGAAVERLRQGGAQIVVCDAQTDGDLELATRALLARPRPLLLAGSIGLAGALRRILLADRAVRPAGVTPIASGRGVLTLVGSAHPTSAAQVAEAASRSDLELVPLGLDEAATAAGQAAGRALAGGRSPAIVAPAGAVPGGSAAVLTAMRRATSVALAKALPGAIVLVGGETAQAVLDDIGAPPIWIESRPFPLVVRGRLLAGPLAGLPLVTKGGSSGSPSLLSQVIRQLKGEVRA